MVNILNFPERKRVKEEAGYWLVKLDMGELGEEEATAFREWLHSDPGHKETLIELAGLWDDMDIMAQLSDLFPLARKQSPQRGLLRSGISRHALKMAVAASLLVVAGLFVLMEPDISGVDTADVENFDSMYRTDVGEQEEISFPDGSLTRLNTDSHLEASFNDDQRNIRLIKGEAHFRVAPDAARPFVVHAGKGMVRAVGTAFNVRLREKSVEVTVSEGQVEIASAPEDDNELFRINALKPARYLTTLEAGQRAEYGEQAIHSVAMVEPEALSREMSWQHGMLVFEGEALEEVVEEISRYTETEIIISDPDIRNIRIGGYFKTGEVGSLLSVLKDNFPVKVDHVNDNLIYLSGEKAVRAQN
ncbi:MAG: FecR domain-containing protein [Gammaproteobacteria bacterium]